MSKQKTNLVAALETAKTSTLRIKENYRFTGIGSREAIICETDKCISASIRSGIKSLLINMLSDADVDLITVSFVYNDPEPNSQFVSRSDKYSIVRNGDFVQVGIDNFLFDVSKVNALTRINFSIIRTDLEKFETVSDNKFAVFPDFDKFGYLSQLLLIYKAFVYELV